MDEAFCQGFDAAAQGAAVGAPEHQQPGTGCGAGEGGGGWAVEDRAADGGAGSGQSWARAVAKPNRSTAAAAADGATPSTTCPAKGCSSGVVVCGGTTMTALGAWLRTRLAVEPSHLAVSRWVLRAPTGPGADRDDGHDRPGGRGGFPGGLPAVADLQRCVPDPCLLDSERQCSPAGFGAVDSDDDSDSHDGLPGRMSLLPLRSFAYPLGADRGERPATTRT
nr:hypothetical protein [Allokutzneria albata]